MRTFPRGIVLGSFFPSLFSPCCLNSREKPFFVSTIVVFIALTCSENGKHFRLHTVKVFLTFAPRLECFRFRRQQTAICEIRFPFAAYCTTKKLKRRQSSQRHSDSDNEAPRSRKIDVHIDTTPFSRQPSLHCCKRTLSLHLSELLHLLHRTPTASKR